MGTNVEKSNYLADTKEEIRKAIVAKGVVVDDAETFRGYAEKIGEITEGGEVSYYDGDYVVIPLAEEEKVLETKNKLMSDDVTVKKVPSYSVDNEYGQTVSIGVEV